MMKTAVTVLQEMMIKMCEVPKYECIAQSGPQHQATFEYRCEARGVVVCGRARSKKEAKQEAARLMLQQLHARGVPVPAPYATPPPRAASPAAPASPERPALPGPAAPAAPDARSSVALLRELCEEYRLGEVQYELVGDTGPPHLRHFTVRAALGLHQRSATATTKKQARQQAAEQLYTYLRENLARLTRDFVEEEALQRAQEKSILRARTDEALERRGHVRARVAGAGRAAGGARARAAPRVRRAGPAPRDPGAGRRRHGIGVGGEAGVHVAGAVVCGPHGRRRRHRRAALPAPHAGGAAGRAAAALVACATCAARWRSSRPRRSRTSRLRYLRCTLAEQPAAPQPH
ncbi:double-stranded RNA-binding protein Staufen homolog isoform X1 [Bicyclus anynana]|uniref:Double-stranded RNA-binding protein Staufen homolog isoform X1 n=1 Tax=Bicyclus anynana TaxID=110368 RepID=A0ABM3LG20_BICAN|nr:double-stranded RNA-binding protein Staufen homolog isoform X1 [Bicyclus anynana]XP_052738005.1 double-stranded RNA-binding protein Staufen homolog isoform X1 [Bicyclus anynana]XP_052738006.1 double-stranded RNA-binding protein Staufen homolog isoform X1 [Bicyclus anynana]